LIPDAARLMQSDGDAATNGKHLDKKQSSQYQVSYKIFSYKPLVSSLSSNSSYPLKALN